MRSNYNYPILRRILDFYKDKTKDTSEIIVVACQHILEPQANMFEKLIGFGLKPENIFVLGKAYSTNKDVMSYIDRELKIRIIQPAFNNKLTFDEQHINNCKIFLEGLKEKIGCAERVIVLDDGAELISQYINKFPNDTKGVCIEQTSSGFRKLEKIKISLPVINVARSTVKLTQESPFIARLCFERISDYFHKNQMKNPKILVVGLGPIGEAVREILIENKFDVRGFDTVLGHSDLIGAITDSKIDVVVGATGSQILSDDDIKNIDKINDKPLSLISVSSSDREFSPTLFRESCNDGLIHIDRKYKNITLANNGFSVTFKGNSFEGTPMEIEKTIALLMGSVIYGVFNNISGRGLVYVPSEIVEIIEG